MGMQMCMVLLLVARRDGWMVVLEEWRSVVYHTAGGAQTNEILDGRHHWLLLRDDVVNANPNCQMRTCP